MKRRLKVTLLILAIVAIILFSMVYYIILTGFVDGRASSGTLTTEETSINEITFTIHGQVFDWYSNPVRFSQSAFSFMVQNRTLSSGDYVFRDYYHESWVDMNFMKVHGPGASNSLVLMDSGSSYQVIFNDVDSDGYLSALDTIVIRSTGQIHSDTEYDFFLATDIHEGMGQANYIGILNGPIQSGL